VRDPTWYALADDRYPGIPYVPLGEYVEPKSVIEEYNAA
jgi:hypothetical protein